jgi:hypothetical protein
VADSNWRAALVFVFSGGFFGSATKVQQHGGAPIEAYFIKVF